MEDGNQFCWPHFLLYMCHYLFYCLVRVGLRGSEGESGEGDEKGQERGGKGGREGEREREGGREGGRERE